MRLLVMFITDVWSSWRVICDCQFFFFMNVNDGGLKGGSKKLVIGLGKEKLVTDCQRGEGRGEVERESVNAWTPLGIYV